MAGDKKDSKLLTVEDIVPKLGKRAFVSGKTGSGKSSLCHVLLFHLSKVAPVIVLDPKERWEIPPHGVLWNGPNSEPATGNYIVYRPAEFTDPSGDIDDICKMIFTMGKNGTPVVLYIDEIYPLLGKDTINGPRFLKFLYTQGRAYGITVICGTQRPSSIPQYLMTEVEYAYLFNTLNPNDRDKLYDFYAPRKADKEDFLDLPKYFFMYYSEDEGMVSEPYSIPVETIAACAPAWK